MHKKRIFIFAYYSYNDPVFQSAVLPYFLNFPEKELYQFILLTFEQKKFSLSTNERKEVEKKLLNHNIVWHRTKWHSGQLKIIKKAFDLSWGIIYSLYLVLKNKAQIVYSEGFPGAIISHFITRITRRKHIIHTFEPHTDYMIESGIWKAKSWEAVLLNKYEKKVALSADLIMTATEAYKKKIVNWGLNQEKIMIVPSCVDTSLFQYNSNDRKEIRNRLNINDNDIIITYLGKFGGMYTEKEFFDFANSCVSNHPAIKFHFWIFTSHSLDVIKGWISNYDNITEKHFLINKLTREEVPKYLSASDVGFVGVKQYPSKRFCSPIKDGEYWSCGLPILIPENISDDFVFTKENELGIVIKKLEEKEYVKSIQEFIEKKDIFSKEKIRNFILSNRDIRNFQKKYHEVFSKYFISQ
ncbi:MAG: glycosyltransferase [Cyclobacteriaceae bacterium]